MQAYYDAVKKKQRDDMLQAAKQAAESAAGWGGLYGALDTMVYGNRSLSNIMLRGLGKAALAAPVAAGATVLGHELLGAPESDDASAYTKRAGLGGGVGGALVGGGLGYMLGAGRLRGLAKIPGIAKVGRFAEKALPLDNLIVDYIKKTTLRPSHQTGLKTALALGGIGGGIGALEGIAGGSEADTLKNLRDEDDSYGDPRFSPAARNY